MQTIQLAVIPGDGIGPEVTAEALKVLEQVAAGRDGVKFESTRYDLGAERYLATGEVLPDAVLDEIRQHDAILLGAVGGRRGQEPPAGHPRAGAAAQAALRARPLREPAPVPDLPGRRLAAGEPGRGRLRGRARGHRGPLHRQRRRPARRHPARDRHRGQRQHRVRRRARRPRRVRPGADAARARSSRWCTRPTCSCTPAASGRGIVDEVAAEFPDVAVDYLHVDAATIFLVTDPARFDVIVTDNLFGDIVTDLAAAITGGIGLAASGNINPDRTAPSMFEPVHGSAPDIAGPGEGRPDRGDPVRGPAAGAPRPRRRGPRGSRRPSWPTSPSVRPAPRVDRRGRRRDRRAESPADDRSQPTRLHGGFGTVHPMDSSLQIEVTPTTSPVSPERAGGDPRRSPASACTSPTTCSRSSGPPRQGWHDAPRHAVRPALARPGHRRPALRAGDLRGPQGLPARGRLGLDLPSRGERRPHGAVRPAARAARAPGRALRRRDRRAGARRRALGARAGGGEEPLPAPVHVRLRDLPRRPALPARHLPGDRLAGGRRTSPGGSSRSRSGSAEDYTRAGRGGTGAAKSGGNYAARLLAQQEAIAEGCDQVVFLDAAERKYVEELGGMNLYFVHDDGTIVTPATLRLDPRGRHPQLDHRALPASSATRSRSGRSRSTSGATVSRPARSPRCSRAAPPRS